MNRMAYHTTNTSNNSTCPKIKERLDGLVVATKYEEVLTQLGSYHVDGEHENNSDGAH